MPAKKRSKGRDALKALVSELRSMGSNPNYRVMAEYPQPRQELHDGQIVEVPVFGGGYVTAPAIGFAYRLLCQAARAGALDLPRLQPIRDIIVNEGHNNPDLKTIRVIQALAKMGFDCWGNDPGISAVERMANAIAALAQPQRFTTVSSVAHRYGKNEGTVRRWCKDVGRHLYGCIKHDPSEYWRIPVAAEKHFPPGWHKKTKAELARIEKEARRMKILSRAYDNNQRTLARGES